MTFNEALKEIQHQVFMNTDNCEMTISKDAFRMIVKALKTLVRVNEEARILFCEAERIIKEMVKHRLYGCNATEQMKINMSTDKFIVDTEQFLSWMSDEVNK